MGSGCDELKTFALCASGIPKQRCSADGQLEIQEGRKDFVSELGLFKMVIHVSGYFENPKETLTSLTVLTLELSTEKGECHGDLQ